MRHATTLDDAALAAMASAGKALAVQWGHEPWSESWARLVAETLLSALRDVEDLSCGDAHS